MTYVLQLSFAIVNVFVLLYYPLLQFILPRFEAPLSVSISTPCHLQSSKHLVFRDPFVNSSRPLTLADPDPLRSLPLCLLRLLAAAAPTVLVIAYNFTYHFVMTGKRLPLRVNSLRRVAFLLVSFFYFSSVTPVFSDARMWSRFREQYCPWGQCAFIIKLVTISILVEDRN